MSTNSTYRLTPQDRAILKAMLQMGYPKRAVARAFDINPRQVYKYYAQLDNGK